jgi:hypothetical protein
MRNPEAHYINAGHRYERARTPGQVAAASQTLRAMLESETPEDQDEGRRLFEQGRREARS